MHSMTGYGRGEATNGDVSVVVEIRSVNNRFRDINVRAPREYLVLEPRIHQLLQGPIHRGRIDVYVRRTATESGHAITSDPALAERYLRAISAVARRLQRLDEAVSLEFILAQPGVLSTEEPEADALSEWSLVGTAVEAARDDLLAMRAEEGRALERDLRRHLDDLQRLWAEVQAASEGVAERLHERLHERLSRLIGDRVDPGRLAMEAAMLADKADISEELARMRSHVKQFSESLGATEPIGRKLEFLVQELHREINTIGSKAAEHPIARRVVEMKSVVERLREQSANVE